MRKLAAAARVLDNVARCERLVWKGVEGEYDR